MGCGGIGTEYEQENYMPFEHFPMVKWTNKADFPFKISQVAAISLQFSPPFSSALSIYIVYLTNACFAQYSTLS